MSNFNISFMQNRITFMERLSERMTTVEAVLKKLEPIENLLERVALLETTSTRPRKSLHSRKRACTSAFQRACYTNSRQTKRFRTTNLVAKCFTSPKMSWTNGSCRTVSLPWMTSNVWLRNHQPHNHSLTRDAMENEKRTELNTGTGINENRLSDILIVSQIKATDTYETPPQIIWIDNSTIATLGNFSASTGKAKSKRRSTCRPSSPHPLPDGRY